MPDDNNSDQSVSGGDHDVTDGNVEPDNTENESGSAEEEWPADTEIGKAEPDSSSMQPPVLNIIAHRNGNMVYGVFFAGKDATIEFETLSGTRNSDVSGGDTMSTVNELIYMIGDRTYSVPVVDGRAVVSVPQNVNGKITFYCVDENGSQSVPIEEYVVSENYLPEIATAIQKDKDGNSYVRVIIEDSSELLSGIREYGYTLDGEVLDPEMNEEEAQWVNLNESFRTLAGFSFDVPLDDLKEHELTVTATDFVGNIAEQTFSVSALPANVINVVMPTNFSMVMFGTDRKEGGLIQGQDIVLCNKSNFPVKVTLKKSKVNLFSEKDELGRRKDCDLTLGLLQAGEDEMSVDLPKGETQDIMSFTLDKAREETDAAALLDESSVNTRLGAVKSPDYALMRVYGSVSQAGWQNGDLNVSFIYTFEKTNDILPQDGQE